ncbi:MAG: N-6 DNA methylase [Frankia sp.]
MVTAPTLPSPSPGTPADERSGGAVAAGATDVRGPAAGAAMAAPDAAAGFPNGSVGFPNGPNGPAGPAERKAGPGERKARGAFFTPPLLCDHVVRWAVRDPGDAVLEPSCGEAAFLLPAARRLRSLGDGHHRGRLRGIELHPESAAAAAGALRAAGEPASVEAADFLSIAPAPVYDAVVGNPPYVRYQSFHGEARARGRAAALRAGVALTNLASSWAAFTVHSSLFLRPGGRLGLVLPAELMSVNYAAPVRHYLLNRFGRVRLVLFAERVFPDVQEEVVLLLAEGEGPAGRFELLQLRDLDDLASLDHPASLDDPVARGERAALGERAVLDGPPGARSLATPGGIADRGGRDEGPEVGGWRPGAPGGGWMPGLLPAPARDVLAQVATSGAFGPLADWGRTTLGAVTGNNRWFALSRERAYALGLPDEELTPLSPPGSRHLRALTLTNRQWADLAAGGAATLLFRPRGEPSAAGRAYIAAGERDGVQLAYKCRVREPWWRVPLQPRPADLLLTYMNAHTPQLATNQAGVAHLNSVHGVALDPAHRELGRDLLPLAALNTVTMLGAETAGRSYGGGVLKLEPREAARLPVPSPELLARLRPELAELRRPVLRALESGRVTDAAALIDGVLLARGAGLPPASVTAVAEARQALWSRRVSRAGGAGTRRPPRPSRP